MNPSATNNGPPLIASPCSLSSKDIESVNWPSVAGSQPSPQEQKEGRQVEVWLSELNAPSASVAAPLIVVSPGLRGDVPVMGGGEVVGVQQGEDEGGGWRVKSVLKKITALAPCLSAR